MTTSPLSEHQEQALFVSRLRLERPGLIFFAIPNGGYRTKSTGRKLKAEGVLAGVSDIFIAEPRKMGLDSYGGLFLEFKSEKGTLQSNQKAFLCSVTELGYGAAVAYGCDEALKIVSIYLDTPDEFVSYC